VIQDTKEEKVMHIGFIGLGHLGKAIAARLLDCGHSLTVWNRTPAKAQGMDVTLADSPAAVAGCDVVFICMFDSNAVHSVLTGNNGVTSGKVSGKIVVDLSTNHFKDVVTFHELCSKAGCIYLEAPVLGSVVPASQGALTVLVSGDEAGYEKVKPVLADIGKNLFFLGDPGLATKMKLINNLALGSFMATIAEALAMAEDCGMAKEHVLDILSAGGGSSLVLSAKKNKLLQEDFSTHFSNALIYKDLHCLQDLAYEQKKTLFTGAVIKELFAKTFEQGIANEDFSAIYKVFKRSST
jgi:3-hydroxyisobutyrate dehydrogenase